MAEIHLPKAWSDWQLTDLVGSGNYGTVYKAERRLKDQAFVSAIKVIPVPPENENTGSIRSEAGDDQAAYDYYHEAVEDFEREIKSMDALKGITNIVTIEDYAVEKRSDRIGWYIYLRMEFLKSFPEYQTEHMMTEDDVIRLGIDLSTALSYCGKARILHRDIKPENIFVSQYGNFKLGDFGISRTFDKTVGSYTQSGTKMYEAPEVMKGGKYGASADQYSLGLVLYVLMNNNRTPLVSMEKQFPGYKERVEALQKRLDGAQLPPPAKASEEFAKIILKAVAYDPKDRYTNIDDMREDLLGLQQKRKTGKTEQDDRAPENDGQKAVVSLRNKRRIAISGIAVAVIAVMILVFFHIQSPQGKHLGGESETEPQTAAEARSATDYKITTEEQAASEAESDTEQEMALETDETSSLTVPMETEYSSEKVLGGSATSDFQTSEAETSVSEILDPLYDRLTRYGTDDYCYFASEDGEYGIYFDKSTFTIESLTNGMGSYSAFKGGSGNLIRGSYTDDGRTIRIQESNGDVVIVEYTLHNDGDNHYLEAKLGNIDPMKFYVRNSMNYFDLGSDVGDLIKNLDSLFG